MYDLCVIGGGASGMAAAISAAAENRTLKICILEKKDAPGKKLMATGNGKCNLTNSTCRNVRLTLDFFSGLGIVTRQDEAGRIYPYSRQAKEVVYGLKRQLDALNIPVFLEREVTAVAHDENGFVVTTAQGAITSEKLLIATGGKAGPQYGTTGDGYRFAKAMGHEIRKVAPVLAAFATEESDPAWKGIRAEVKVRLFRKNTEIAEEDGELQFTADGLSGICIFNLSRYVKLDETTTFRDYSVSVDFMPDMSRTQADDFLQSRQELTGLLCGDLLLSVIAKPLALEFLKTCGADLQAPAQNLPEDVRHRLSKMLKSWNVRLAGVKGWKDAQCSAGGVLLEEIHMDTMESKIVPGLYFAGEVIDFDGPCGGYNLQNAWETGIRAGKAMAHV